MSKMYKTQTSDKSMKNDYKPVNEGAPLRGTFIEQLKNKWGSNAEISICEENITDAIRSMFDFEPLVPHTLQEIRLLKQYTESDVRRQYKKMLEVTRNLLSVDVRIGKWTDPENNKKTKPTQEEALSILRDGKTCCETRIFLKGDVEETSLESYGSRGLDGYLREGGFDVLKYCIEMQKKAAKINLLDVGSANANMLGELKEKTDGKVVTHALSPLDEPRFEVDFYHFLTAEHMPKSFRRSFDLVISHRALEYAIFPHLALQNITESLAEGGQAYIHWRPGRVNIDCFLNSDMIPDINQYYTNYLYSSASKFDKVAQTIFEANELCEGSYDTGIRNENDALRRMTKVLEDNTNFSRKIEVSWCMAVRELKDDPELKVTFPVKTMGEIGWLPGRVLIERKSATDRIRRT